MMEAPAQASPGGLALRQVEPELLDGLPADHPDARASRRDLRRVNVLMFQTAIARRLLLRHAPRTGPLRVLEIGAGDGTGALKLAKSLGREKRGSRIVLLDRAAAMPPGRGAAFAGLGWQMEEVAADVFGWLESGADTSFDAVLANLFLHHFDDTALLRLFSLLRRRTRLLVATEPHRDGFSHAASRLLWALGANRVTRHDAPASVRAGFRGTELGRLWEQAGGTALEEGRRRLFTHAFAGAAP